MGVAGEGHTRGLGMNVGACPSTGTPGKCPEAPLREGVHSGQEAGRGKGL